MDGEIIEIRENELCKCRAFWDMPVDLTSDRLYNLVNNNLRRAFVFKTDVGYIGGCALFVREDGNGHLSYFNVAPEYRRRGIGSKLIDFAEQYFRSRGVSVFGLNVMKDNADAIRLYERKGLRYAFDKTPEKIYMTKQLTVKPRVDYNTELIQTIKVFYHGSAVKGIRTLLPFSKSHNTIKKPVVYLTPNETLALFYIWDRPYKFVTFEENEQGSVVYTEWYENQFSDLMRGLSGSIYECEDDPRIYATHIAGVYNSDEPINVCKETVIADVFNEIQKRIADGRVILRTYGLLDAEQKEKIVKSDMVRAIHMQRLLKPNKTETDTAYAAFIREHFPLSWSIAEKMSDKEINAMYDEWMSSVQ